MNLEMLSLAQVGLAPGGFSMTYIVIIGVSMLASFLISGTLKRRFKEYSQIPIRMTGAQIAEAMLRQHGINDVQVICTPGHLTDHYDPTKKTVNLSESVYSVNSVAAAAVAAHECGHAVQHQQAYHWLGLRSKLVPAVEFSSKMLNWLMIIGILGIGVAHSPVMLWAKRLLRTSRTPTGSGGASTLSPTAQCSTVLSSTMPVSLSLNTMPAPPPSACSM